MPRQPLPVGVPGKVTVTPYHRGSRVALDGGRYDYPETALTRHSDGLFYAKTDVGYSTPLPVTYWRARCRVRDNSGRLRIVEGSGKSAAASERTLQRKLTEHHAHTGGEITPNTFMDDLWTAYRAQLVDEGKASRTLDAYDEGAARISQGLGRLRIREVTTQRLDAFLGSVEERNGPAVAKRCRALLSGMLRLAVRYGAAQHNPAREVRTIRTAKKPATALTPDDVRTILTAVTASTAPMPPAKNARRQTARLTIAEYSRVSDVTDVVIFLAGTGVRIGEALAVRWVDVDLELGTVGITGHVVEARGKGVQREAGAKSMSGVRTLHAPQFVLQMLRERQQAPLAEISPYVFASAAGTLRSPSNLGKSWRRVFAAIGYEGVSPHAFRRAYATQLDDAGLSARIAADALGHAQVSMTQDVYLGRNRAHGIIAEVIDTAFTPSDEMSDVAMKVGN